VLLVAAKERALISHVLVYAHFILAQSWKDGLAFAALAAAADPNSIDFDSLRAGEQDAIPNLRLSFAAAKKLGVSILLDPEDVVSKFMDKKSMVTQLFQYQQSLGGRRV
jgi:hypothetical protein